MVVGLIEGVNTVMVKVNVTVIEMDGVMEMVMIMEEVVTVMRLMYWLSRPPLRQLQLLNAK